MSSVTPLAASTRTSCQVVFGRSSAQVTATRGHPLLHVAVPVLAGLPDESLLAGGELADASEDHAVYRAGSRRAGFAVAAPGADLEQAAVSLYRRLFAVTRGLHLHRIWNYVPQINAIEHDLENYRRFCRGRSLAFEQHFGPGFQKLLPAASAVGAVTGPLALGFLAGQAEPQHFENPRQVPAFEYPQQYGPRPPSFARSTAFADETGRHILISGTAAILGHETVAAGDCDGQLTCTLDNLRRIAAAAGGELGAPSGWSRRFKIYLRHAADLPRVSRRLQGELLLPGDTAQYLQADICRASLLVEIEASLSSA